MVYLTSWEEFVVRAEDMFRRNPMETRYVSKYRHCDAKLVLKVTDNLECLQYKTESTADLKKIDKLNNLFLFLTTHGKDAKFESEQVPSIPNKAKHGRRG